jgi:hypothetical protein
MYVTRFADLLLEVGVLLCVMIFQTLHIPFAPHTMGAALCPQRITNNRLICRGERGSCPAREQYSRLSSLPDMTYQVVVSEWIR